MIYRVGTHHGVTICAEPDAADGVVWCGHDGHDCARGHLVAVVVNGDHALAERICDLLNGPPYPARCTLEPGVRGCVCQPWPDCYVGAPQADSCTCTIAGPTPDCLVHHGRRARGPKPPNPPGCICDGSGRACPRHGAVI